MKKQQEFKSKEVTDTCSRFLEMVILGMLAAFVVVAVYAAFNNKAHATQLPQEENNWSEWTDTSECVGECGSSSGTKSQERYLTEEICELSCPVIHFQWSTESCPSGYSPWIGDLCEKNGHQFDIKPKVVTLHNADVEYEKSQDPNKCHRPSDSTLMQEYGMDHDAKQEFKEDNSEWKYALKSDCTQETVDTEHRTVECELEVIACEEPYDACPNMEGNQEFELECLEDTPESTPSEDPRDEPENTFHEDRRCLDSTPPLPTWAYRFWIDGEYLANWSANGGSKVDIEVTNSNGEYEYQYHGLTNDGHEILPNVGISQEFRVRTVNGCKRSDWIIDPLGLKPFIVL